MSLLKGLLQQIVSERDMDSDQQHWFGPRATLFREFSDQVRCKTAWKKQGK